MLSFREQECRLEILKADSPVPLIVQNASPATRPYLHPMLAPDGIGIVTEDSPPTHPWQHGLYFGLNKVNGVGFWTEGLRPKSQPTDGTVSTTKLSSAAAGEVACWRVQASWRAPAGDEVFTDSIDWKLSYSTECYWLDATWRLTAKVDIDFGKHAYGGMFLRMPVNNESDPRLLSSNGSTSPDAAEGQRARWLAVATLLPERMTFPDDRRHVCMTIMDHPSNPEHPVPWRADSKYGIGPSRCVIGPWHLDAGQSVTFYHRILVTIGVPSCEKIESSYRDFSGTNPCQPQS